MKHHFFASDFHLGAHADGGSRDRERKVVRWLHSIADRADTVYLLGDVFDFWFDYRDVVPRGHTRLLGTLADLSDAGVNIHFFTGNHDLWLFDYFQTELGATIHRQPLSLILGGKQFVIGHGDGLGPGDHRYKFTKAVFSNALAQRLFAALHPRIGVGLARYFSRKSRETTGQLDDQYLGDEREFLVQYCVSELKNRHVDFFIFGHRHLVIDKPLPGGARYINLGTWFGAAHYAEFDGQQLHLRSFEG